MDRGVLCADEPDSVFFNGVAALFASIFNGALFFFSGMFGHTLREVASANGRNQQLLGELRSTQEQLHALAIAEERNRLARDLHDSVKQQLFATTMRLGAARASLTPDAPAYEHIAAAERMAKQAGEELTAIIRTLRPVAMEQRTLPDALRSYVADWSRQHGIAADVQIRGTAPLSSAAEEALFRVAQEALANVARHSGATHVAIELLVEQRQGKLIIHDDGHGFDAASIVQGFGLTSMLERMRAIGGSVVIDSKARFGTKVTAVCALQELAR